MKGGTLDNSYQPLQQDGSAPADAAFATVTGWQVGANPVGDQSELRPNVKQANTTFIVQTVPTALGTGASANAFKSPAALTGTFDAANWTLSAVFRSTVLMAVGQQIRLRWRVFASTDPAGASPRELTSAVQTTSTVAATGNTTTNFPATSGTWAAPSITMSNENLFFAIAMEVMAASGTGGTRDATFRENSASSIVTANFTPAAPSLLVPTDIRTRSLIRR